MYFMTILLRNSYLAKIDQISSKDVVSNLDQNYCAYLNIITMLMKVLTGPTM